MQDRFNLPVDLFPDMATPLRIAVETIVGKTFRGNPITRGRAYHRVIWLSSRAAFSRLEKMMAEYTAAAPNKHHVVPTDNFTYRGNIIVAGLLMAEDFIRAGLSALKKWPDADLFLVPSNPFDALLRDLVGTPAYRISERLGRPVWLVQSDGIIESLSSMRLLKRRKPLDSGLKKAMDQFNLARIDGEKIESVLNMVAIYPVASPRGSLSRDQMKNMIREDRARTFGRDPLSQKFEILDQIHAICLETWML